MATDPHDERPFRAMSDEQLLAAHLSYRATAKSSRGSHWLFDQNRSIVTHRLLCERGLVAAVERAVAAMKASKWLALPVDVAREALGQAASA